MIAGRLFGVVLLVAVTTSGCHHVASSVNETRCDGKYAVLPWDTFPEFGKIRAVESATMTLKRGDGKIVIAYEDGTHYSIDVKILVADEGLRFSYAFPGYVGTPFNETVPLRNAGGFLDIFYGRRWVRFAKETQQGELIDYPGWDGLTEEAWGTP